MWPTQYILTRRHRTTLEQQEINQILSPQKIHSSTVSLEMYAHITVTFIYKDQEDHLGGKKKVHERRNLYFYMSRKLKIEI